MKLLRALLFAWMAVCCLSGCLQVEKVVKLNTDGSGTIEETLVFNKASLAKIQQMMAGFGGDKAAGGGQEFKLLDEEKLKQAAGKMGEGVTFVSATPISTDQGEGYKAIYAFTDINLLKVEQNPNGTMPGSGENKVPDAQAKKEPVTFRFHKGNPAELVIAMPQPDFKPKKETPEAGSEDMLALMMQQMFKDMKITLGVEVSGTIQETNAEFHDASRVTLMEMDMNKVLADPEKFRTLAKANPQSLQEAKGMVKGIDGVKVETASEVRVKFQ